MFSVPSFFLLSLVELKNQKTLSLPELCTDSDQQIISSEAGHSLNFVLQNIKPQRTLSSNNHINSCTEWHTASDGNLSLTKKRRPSCRNNALPPSQKFLPKQNRERGPLIAVKSRKKMDETHHQSALVPVFAAKSCQSDSLLKHLTQAGKT